MDKFIEGLQKIDFYAKLIRKYRNKFYFRFIKENLYKALDENIYNLLDENIFIVSKCMTNLINKYKCKYDGLEYNNYKLSFTRSYFKIDYNLEDEYFVIDNRNTRIEVFKNTYLYNGNKILWSIACNILYNTYYDILYNIYEEDIQWNQN